MRPLLRSLKEATQFPYKVFFICSKGDAAEIKACRETSATTFVVPWEPGHGDFAKKINWLFPQTDAPWIFQAADDLKFHHGWDVQAMRVGDRRKAGVIGTNDMGNPLVRRGGHSTHTFISRHYIAEYGGTFDDTGLVFCELYDHQYCDNEFVQTAIRRGQWAFSKRSMVEHLHPHWRKSAMDETYEKATRSTLHDQKLYMRRMKLGDRMERRARMKQTRAERVEAKRARRRAQ